MQLKTRKIIHVCSFLYMFVNELKIIMKTKVLGIFLIAITVMIGSAFAPASTEDEKKVVVLNTQNFDKSIKFYLFTIQKN